MPIALNQLTEGKSSGTIGEFLPGTGTSKPTGLFAIWEYNGLNMNIVDNADKYRITSVEGLMDAEVRDNRTENPEDDGEVEFDAYYSGKTITITGRIESGNYYKKEDMEEALIQAFAELRSKPLYIKVPDSSEHAFINCRKSAPIALKKSQDTWFHRTDFLITLRAPDPHIYSVLQQNITLDIDNGTVLTQVTNRGNAQTRPRFILYGPFDEMTVQNATTGDNFTVGAVGVDEYVILEFLLGRKTMRKSDGTRAFNLLSTDSSRTFRIDRNSTDEILVTTSGAGAGTLLNIAWRDAWH